MIKVEKLLEGGSGYAFKYGDKVPLIEGLLLDDEQYRSVVVETGSIVFSIHESELVTRTHEPIVPAPAPVNAADPTPPPNPNAPQIVWPAKKR